MRVSNNYIFRQVADEFLLVPVGETALSVKGLIRLSESGGMLYQMMQERDCTKEELLQAILAEYDVAAEDAAADVDALLDQMRSLDMLVEAQV